MPPTSQRSALRLPRRSFLAIASAWLASCMVPLGALGCRVLRPRSPTSPTGAPGGTPDSPSVLAEDAILDAVVARLVPSGDGLPGAREAGVMNYLRRALTERHWSLRRDRILDGCQRLQILSQEQFADDFALLPPEDQDALLRHVETGRVDTDTFSGQPWLHDLLEITLEGLLGDPVHGGNRDEVGWSLISYAPGSPRPGRCNLHHDDSPGAKRQQ